VAPEKSKRLARLVESVGLVWFVDMVKSQLGDGAVGWWGGGDLQHPALRRREAVRCRGGRGSLCGGILRSSSLGGLGQGQGRRLGWLRSAVLEALIRLRVKNDS
jgi:hypothetical protein